MNKELLTQLNQWYKDSEHSKIIDTISDMPQKKLNFEFVGQLGRAYNNKGEYDKAIEILMTVSEEGKTVALWNYRIGYSYFYKSDYKEALYFFRKSAELGDDEAIEFCDWCEAQLNLPERKFASLFIAKEDISVSFHIELEKLFQLGRKLNAIHSQAYMNGYNWKALLNHYLQKYHPDILKNMGTYPEAGMYTAYYSTTPENEIRAKKLLEVIRELVENENLLFEFLKKEGDHIKWD